MNGAKEAARFLACPRCKQKIVEDDKSYTCGHCSLNFKKSDEFIDFLYFNSGDHKPQLDYSSAEANPSRYSKYFSKFSRGYTSTWPLLWYRFLGGDFNCLDIGAGLVDNGEIKPHMQDLKKYCPVYFGIDPCEKELKRDKIIDNVILLKGVGEYLPLNGNCLDLVVISCTLDHCFDYKMALSEIYRVLKKDGIVFIFLTNNGSWVKRMLHGRAEKRRRDAAGNHNFFFDPASLSSDLERTGFKTIYIRGFRYLILPETVLNAISVVTGPAMVGVLRFADYLGNKINPNLGGDFALIARK